MAVKIKVSYEHPEELQRQVLDKYKPEEIKCFKVAKRQEGRFKRAYIELKT